MPCIHLYIRPTFGQYPHLSCRAPNSYRCVFVLCLCTGGSKATFSQNMVNETKFVNGTSVVLQLKSGSNGVFRDICKLSPQSHDGNPQKHEHVMKIDPNSTYLEYWLGTGYRGESVLVNADECNDNKVIKIVKDGDKFTFIPTPRYGPKPVKVSVPTISEGNPDLQSPSPSSSHASSRSPTHHHRWSFNFLRRAPKWSIISQPQVIPKESFNTVNTICPLIVSTRRNVINAAMATKL